MRFMDKIVRSVATTIDDEHYCSVAIMISDCEEVLTEMRAADIMCFICAYKTDKSKKKRKTCFVNFGFKFQTGFCSVCS